MKMTMRIVFDPLAVAPGALLKAVEACGVKATDVSLHHQREATAKKGKS